MADIEAIFISREAGAMHPFPTGFQVGALNPFFFQHTINDIFFVCSQQAAHSFEDISADCKPSSAALTCCLPVLVRFSLSAACFCWSSAFLFFAASLCSALHFFSSSFSSAFLFRSASLFSFSSAFRIFSCSLCCFFSSHSFFRNSFAACSSFFCFSFSGFLGSGLWSWS